MNSLQSFTFHVFLVLGTILSYQQNGWAESYTDSLENKLKETSDTLERIEILNNLFLEFEFEDQVKAADYLSQAFNLAFESPYKKQLAVVYTHQGYFAEDTGNYSAAEVLYSQALDISKELGDLKGTIAGYNHMGIACKYQSDFPRALFYYLKALELLERWQNYSYKYGTPEQQIDLENGLSAIYNNIGNLHYNQAEYAESEPYFLKSVAIDKKLNNTYGLAIDYNNLSLLYWRLETYEKSLVYSDSAIACYTEENSQMGISECLMNRAITLKYMAMDARKRGELSMADSLFELVLNDDYTSLEIKKTTGDKLGIANVLQNIGIVYYELKQYSKAREYLTNSQKILIEIGNKTTLSNNYRSFYKLDSAEQKWAAAFMNYHQFIRLQEVILNEENTKKIVQMEMTHSFNKERAADSLIHVESDKLKDAEIATRDLAIKHNRAQKIYLIVGLFLVVVFTVFIFNRLRVTRQQKLIIEKQKEVVEEKNKEILDSINYAKRIQNAILPPHGDLQQFVQDSFILYKPKDIVAGDFYWIEKSADKLLIAAADCTGHGVPGAMVSVLCSNALTKCVKELGLTEPAKILDKTAEIIQENFAKSEVTMNDGMDIGLCCLDLKKNTITFAGANNPLYLIRSETLTEYKADKQPIGKYENRKPYQQTEIALEKGDRIYLLTDGYADQFGGPDEKKFKYKTLKELLIRIHLSKMDLQKNELNKAFESWKGNLEQIDDVCLIGIQPV